MIPVISKSRGFKSRDFPEEARLLVKTNQTLTRLG